MIEFVRGTLDELTPATAVIDCNGVGYLLNISLNTFSAIQGKTHEVYTGVTIFFLESKNGKPELTKRKEGCKTIRLRGYPRRCLRSVRICHKKRARAVPAAHLGFGHWRQLGTNDSVGIHSGRTVRHHNHRERQGSEGRKRHRTENGTTNNC